MTEREQLMRPTEDDIYNAIVSESQSHAIGNITPNIAPAIEVPGKCVGWDHEVTCKCGYVLGIRTMDKLDSKEGANQFNSALTPRFTEHCVRAVAAMVYKLHD